MNNDRLCYLNGQFLPLAEARISVMDRGFLFGDGVYEVIPVYGGRLFRLGEHLNRLAQSLELIRLPDPLTRDAWATMLKDLVNRNGGGQQSLYLQVTRGAAPVRDHAFPDPIRPTVFAMVAPLATPDPAILERGIRVATVPDIRWDHCHIKAITLLPNVLLKQQARDSGADEALLIRNGEATEGSASNLFVVSADTLITPPKSNLLLPGITRDLVVELAKANGIACEERSVPEDLLRHADEVWVTSSTREVMPVIRVDDQPVGSGKAGPLWQRVYSIYCDYKRAVSAGEIE